MHGLSLFLNKFTNKLWQNCTCPRASVGGCIKNESKEFSPKFSSFRIIFVFYNC